MISKDYKPINKALGADFYAFNFSRRSSSRERKRGRVEQRSESDLALFGLYFLQFGLMQVVISFQSMSAIAMKSE